MWNIQVFRFVQSLTIYFPGCIHWPQFTIFTIFNIKYQYSIFTIFRHNLLPSFSPLSTVHRLAPLVFLFLCICVFVYLCLWICFPVSIRPRFTGLRTVSSCSDGPPTLFEAINTLSQLLYERFVAQQLILLGALILIFWHKVP